MATSVKANVQYEKFVVDNRVPHRFVVFHLEAAMQ